MDSETVNLVLIYNILQYRGAYTINMNQLVLAFCGFMQHFDMSCHFSNLGLMLLRKVPKNFAWKGLRPFGLTTTETSYWDVFITCEKHMWDN